MTFDERRDIAAAVAVSKHLWTYCLAKDIRRLCKLDEEKIISVLNNAFFLAKYMGVCTA
jgi:hypothetical protein